MKHDSTDDWVKENEGLIYYTLQLCNCFYDDEAYSVALEAFWRAHNTYNSAKGKFSTYAVTCMRNALYDMLKKNQKINESEVPIDLFYNLSCHDTYSWEREESTGDPVVARSVDEALSKMRGKKRAVAELWYASFRSATDIAEEVPCSQSYASQAIAEFKHLVRKELENAGYRP